ncbi:MAG: hypothetical protein KDE09_14320 [Anaerolineales bacterium]|nr:hypothetical protein [Anaerolineales bacterium]
MNEILLAAFRHKLWAMKQLINACKERSLDELTRPAGGCGTILATLNHLVIADAGYVASLGAERPEWASYDQETNDLHELLERAGESGALWEQFLQQPIDGAMLAYLDDGTYETHADVVLMQALHHASIHGEQICASLEAMGVQPPDLQPWELADTTGRSRWLTPE